MTLLWCDVCDAVWPTERDVCHGGSRRNGEPCAYRQGGRTCSGVVRAGPNTRRLQEGYNRLRWGRYETPSPPWNPPVAPYAPRATWYRTLGVPDGTTDLARVRTAYRAAVKGNHPDAGGSHAAMVALNAAYAEALAELGQP